MTFSDIINGIILAIKQPGPSGIAGIENDWPFVEPFPGDGSEFLAGDGTFKTPSGGDLTGWTSTLDTASPNDEVNASHLLASGGTADQDAVVSPKADGAFQLTEATGDSTGGNKRGVNAVDLQIWPATPGKTSPTAVASGANSFAVGFGSTASGAFAIAMGQGASALADNAVAIGEGVEATSEGEINIRGVASITIGAANGGQGSFTIDGTTGNLTSEINAYGLGFDSPATGALSFTLGGYDSVADGDRSGILLGSGSWTRGISGYLVTGVGAGPGEIGSGSQQLGLFTLAVSTTDATPAALTSDGGAPSAVNQPVLPDNSSYSFRGRIIGFASATVDCANWEFVGLINRATGAATTALVAAVTPTQIAATAGASSWNIAVTADTANGAIQVTVTGAASTSIHWIGRIETEELAW